MRPLRARQCSANGNSMAHPRRRYTAGSIGWRWSKPEFRFIRYVATSHDALDGFRRFGLRGSEHWRSRWPRGDCVSPHNFESRPRKRSGDQAPKKNQGRGTTDPHSPRADHSQKATDLQSPTSPRHAKHEFPRNYSCPLQCRRPFPRRVGCPICSARAGRPTRSCA